MGIERICAQYNTEERTKDEEPRVKDQRPKKIQALKLKLE